MEALPKLFQIVFGRSNEDTIIITWGVPTGGKIVGGSPAAAGEIPWQVSLQTTDGFQSCGASIISEEWILTAAHCSDIIANNYQIRAGSLLYESGGSIHKIEEIITNDFQPNNMNLNDVAVMRISPPFVFDGNTNKVSLPAQDTPIAAGTVITVSGWGSTRFLGSVSEELLKVDMPLVDKAECDSIYSGIAVNQICAGLPEGGVDSCQGDSGGPLYKDGVQYGIVSYGTGCAWARFPGVYTEVSAYRDWINQITGA